MSLTICSDDKAVKAVDLYYGIDILPILNMTLDDLANKLIDAVKIWGCTTATECAIASVISFLYAVNFQYVGENLKEVVAGTVLHQQPLPFRNLQGDQNYFSEYFLSVNGTKFRLKFGLFDIHLIISVEHLDKINGRTLIPTVGGSVTKFLNLSNCGRLMIVGENDVWAKLLVGTLLKSFGRLIASIAKRRDPDMEKDCYF